MVLILGGKKSKAPKKCKKFFFKEKNVKVGKNLYYIYIYIKVENKDNIVKMGFNIILYIYIKVENKDSIINNGLKPANQYALSVFYTDIHF